MNKIDVKHSSIVINNYVLGDCERLEKQFEVFDISTHSYYYLGLYYDEANQKLYLPRGIDIWFVEKCLDNKAYINRKCDKYAYASHDLLITKKPRDETQKEALRFLLGKGEYNVTSKHSQLSLNLSTGKGKSYCSLASCAYESFKFAIISYSTDCLEQWIDYIHEYLPSVNNKNICYIKGSNVIKRLLDKGADNYDVFLISYGTLTSYAKNYGWEEITKLFSILHIGTKIIDEAHQNFTAMYMLDFFTNTRKTVYVTASKGRSSEQENRVYQLYFKNVLSIDLFDAERDPHTHYKSILFNSHPSPTQISECKNVYGFNRIKYMEYLVNTKTFYKVLSIIVDIILTHNAKTLIYIGINNAIETVYNWLIDTFPMLNSSNVGIYSSLTPKECKQDELKKLIILSTTKSCGAAMDIKGLKITVVANEPFKSDIIAIQSLGRTRDPNTIYYELVDTGFYYTKYFYNCKKPIFSKYALDMKEIKISDDELDIKYEDIINKWCNVNNHQLIDAIVYRNKEE